MNGMYLCVFLQENEQGEVQKSKEQLEAEKRSFLSQRIKPLPDLSGLDEEKLAEQAKELHKEIYRLMNEKYDIEEKFKRQQYDVSIGWSWGILNCIVLITLINQKTHKILLV